MNVSRREVLRNASVLALGLGTGVHRGVGAPSEAEMKTYMNIDRNRPSRREWLPHDFSARFGAAHVAGKYFLTKKPFLIEGADRLIELGTRLGKFWFDCERPERSYPFHSEWPRCHSLLELAKTDYFEQVFLNPFETIVLEASSPVDHGWEKPVWPAESYAAVEHEYHEVALHCLRKFRDRSLTIVLQNWEGDWMLRGSDKKWTPPPAGWERRCEAMQRWLGARQAGVTRARVEAGASKCIVAHAAEVNRVADGFKGIPTMTRNVLPGVEVDLVSYSAYDGMNAGPVEFWKCLGEIRAHARTGKLFGPGALAIGEFGIPENASPKDIAERYDEALAVMLTANVRYAAHWQLYCNEFASADAPQNTPVTDPKLLRGFWLVKPDGSLSEGGKYFSGLWERAG
jgi:hypothetical protein